MCKAVRSRPAMSRNAERYSAPWLPPNQRLERTGRQAGYLVRTPVTARRSAAIRSADNVHHRPLAAAW